MSRITETEDRISEVEDKMVEINEAERKKKKESKEMRMRGSFQSPGNPRAGGSGGSFQISEGNLTGRRN